MENKIKKGNVFRLKDNVHSFVEIIAVAESKVKVLVHSNKGSKNLDVSCSDLEDVPLTAPILKNLGFEEKDGSLMGLPNECFWYKCVDDFYFFMVKEDGVFKIARNKDDAFYGVKFIPIPFLHELQNIIGHIDVKKLFEDVYCNI